MKKLEFKIGIFFLTSILLLITLIIFFGNFNFFEQGYNVKVHFSFTNGIKIGAPVRFSGVEIGLVKNIFLLKDGTSVELLLWIKKGIVVRENVKIYVNTLGVMGEKYIEFSGGSTDFPILTGKSPSLKGVDPIAINEMAGLGKNLANEISTLVLQMQQVIGDEKIRENFKETINNTKETVKNLNSFISELRSVLGKNKSNLYKTLKNMKSSSLKLEKDLDILKSILEKINNGQGSLGKFITNDSFYKNIEELSLDVKQNPWKLLIKTREPRIPRALKNKRE